MPPWLYALGFIAVMLVVGWVADRRAGRSPLALVSPAAITAGPASAARALPITRSRWHNGETRGRSEGVGP